MVNEHLEDPVEEAVAGTSRSGIVDTETIRYVNMLTCCLKPPQLLNSYYIMCQNKNNLNEQILVIVRSNLLSQYYIETEFAVRAKLRQICEPRQVEPNLRSEPSCGMARLARQAKSAPDLAQLGARRAMARTTLALAQR